MNTKIKLSTGTTVTREDIIEGLCDLYKDVLRFEREEDPSLIGYPDYVAMLDYIEKHGLPPRNE